MMRFLTAATLLALATPASAGFAPLALGTVDTSPSIGTTIELRVEIGTLDIGCYSFSVEFDPSVLDYLGALEGPLFTGASASSYFSDDIDEQSRPQPNACLLGFGTSVSGPGSIAILRFIVLDDIATTVTLKNPVLRDVDRLALAGITEVSAELNATATSTGSLGPTAGLLALPNPSSSHMSLVFSGRAPTSPGRLSIFDAAGRLVREMVWPAHTSNRGWDGRDTEGRLVANGVYHARLESGSRRMQTRIVRVR
jgi:hypothetical protein